MSAESSQFVFPMQGAATLRELNLMRTDGMLTDVIIVVEDREFKCHRAVLAASCPYFKGMFLNGLRECSESKITIHGVSPVTMELILEYAYTGTCGLTRDSASSTLAAADLFGLVPLRDASALFLRKCIDVRNCLQIRQLADEHSCRELHQESTEFTRKYFTDVINQEEFLQLNLPALTSYFDDDDIHIAREDLVYDAAMRWIRHDEDARKEHTEKVLGSVRLPFVKPEYLKLQATVDPLIYHNPACVRQVLEARTYQISGEFNNNFELQQRKPRKCDSKEVLLVVGGQTRVRQHQEEVDDVIYYDTATSKWETLTTLPSTLNVKAFSAICIGYKIYLVGGTRNNKSVSDVTAYCTYSKTWRPLPEMNIARYHHACAAIKDTIYAIGGTNGRGCIADVEVYETTREKGWRMIKPMMHAVKCPAAEAYNNQIYVLAGFSDNYMIHKAIQMYSPETGGWTNVSSPEVDYACANAAVSTSEIYLLGGSSRFVKIFDPKTCRVTGKAPDMIQKRDNCALASIGEELYVTGGLGSSTGPSMNSVERYCPRTAKWELITEMPSSRHRHESMSARIPIYP